ncbi:MAG: energy transducer TonB [Pseudobdellovibrionaceae bacterium]|nr:energy transducer TonB [Pseudobdellovibrionaceae bacterium]
MKRPLWLKRRDNYESGSEILPTFERGRSNAFAVYHFQIDDDGAPKNRLLLRSYPEGVFEKAALEAIREWRYASLKDEPNSQGHNTVTIQFQLVGQNHVSSCDYGFERKTSADGSAGTP